MIKMAGVPRARPNQLKAQHANTADNGEDIHYFWGEGTSKTDAHLLSWALNHRPLMTNLAGEIIGYEDSLLQQLQQRGYDLKTLRFSIDKTST